MSAAGYNLYGNMAEHQTSSASRWRSRAWGCAILVLALLALMVGMGGRRWFLPAEEVQTPVITVPATLDPAGTASEPPRGIGGKLAPTPTSLSPLDAIVVPPEVGQQPVPERASNDLESLYQVIVPVHDYFRTAEELAGFDLGDRQVRRESYQVGDRAIFNTADGSRQAELLYKDDLAYYWIELGLALDREALIQSAEHLRTMYYPALVQTFGTEWRPGVDGDPIFSIFHILGPPDAHELGYFIDENSYPATLFNQSNVQEMVYLNMSRLSAGTPLYEGTLVHEIQHLIQWNMDANEDTWLNEGLSQIAETLVGLDTVNFGSYLEQTNIRLDRWPAEETNISTHYAASYLYLLYLWEQVGDAGLRELSRHPANGLAAIRAILAGYRPDQTLARFTADWATAIYLDGQGGMPPYAYERVDLSPPFYAGRARQLPYEAVTELEQFAVDYVDLDLAGRAVITFAGDTQAPLIDAPPTAGDGFWYAVPANSGRAQLTAAVDLRDLKTAALQFDAWYDLEEDYDFAYVTVSTDGGQTWAILAPQQHMIGSYGPAMGGRSDAVAGNQNGWVRESVSLDGYAGQEVMLRFEAVTDFEITGRGLAIAGSSISGLETQPVWKPDGFAWSGVTLPQPWAVRLIRRGTSPEIFDLELDANNRGQMVVELGPEGGVLVIVPLNPFVETAATYWLRISR